jgi:fibronectin type 3 domain-containing protein
VYLGGVGVGFQFTAPADLTTRTLTVYVGGFDSTGQLTATLSDGAAPPYVSPSLGTSGQFNGTYQLTYSAAGAGRTLTVQWKQLTGAGNVTLQGAALAGGGHRPAGGADQRRGQRWHVVHQCEHHVDRRSAARPATPSIARPPPARRASAIGTPTAATFSDTTATPGTTYYYGVTATNAAGTSALSAQNSGFAAAPPAVPTNVAASDGTSATSVNITWTAVTGANSYTVYRSTSAGTQGSAIGTPTAATFSDTTATPGTTYYYGVTATGTGGTSALSVQDAGYRIGPPAVPTNVAATDGTSATSVTITWTAVSGATSYTVYRSTTAGTQGSAIGTPTATTFTDSTATPGTTYYYGVTATGTGGTSALSAQDAGFAAGSGGGGGLVGAVLPVASPVNLTAVGTSDWGQWASPSLFNHKSTGGGQISTYTAIGSPWVSGYGNDPRTLTWTDGTPTATGSSTQGVYLGGVGVGFQFTAPADLTTRTLTVYVGGFDSTGQLTATLSDGAAPPYVSPSLGTSGQFNGTYQLTYSAAGAGRTLTVQWKQLTGAGNVTLQGAALAGGGIAPPAVPTNVTASDGTSSTSVNITWAAVSGATSYTVYRSTSAGTQGSAIGTPTAATFSDTTATPGTTYYYGVTATGTGGTSALSAQDAGYRIGPPAVPTNVAATDGTSATSVTISWTAVSGATSYTVYRSTTAGTQGSAIGTPTVATFSDTTATPGTTYYYGVTATGTGGTSALSAQDAGYRLAPPAVPTNVAASDGTGPTVTVTWTAVTGATSYTVYRSTTAGTQGSALGSTSASPFTDSTATPGTTYYYGVTATNAAGTGALSAQNSGFATATAALTGSVLAVTSPVNLATVGTSDWAHWSGTGLDHKATGGSQISNYTLVGTGQVAGYGNDPRTLSWTGGTPTESGSNKQGIYIGGIGKGFQFTAPASTTTRTIVVYVGGWHSTAQLTATLSDGSAPAYVSPALSSNGQFDGTYQITYRAAGAGQTLTIRWTQTAGTGNVTLQGAALQ